jgi:hypothetical protein
MSDNGIDSKISSATGTLVSMLQRGRRADNVALEDFSND